MAAPVNLSELKSFVIPCGKVGWRCRRLLKSAVEKHARAPGVYRRHRGRVPPTRGASLVRSGIIDSGVASSEPP